MKTRILVSLALMATSLFCQGTLSLSNAGTPPVAGYVPGATVTLNVTKTGNATATGLQFDLNAPTGMASLSIALGPAVTAGSKQITCAGALAPRCVIVGLNTTVIPDGTIAVVTAVLVSAISTSPVNVTISNPIEADLNGNGLVVTVGNPTVSLSIRNACDVNLDGSVSSADLSAVVNQLVTKANAAATDLNKDSSTDVKDAQIVGTAATPPTFVCNAQ